MQEKQWQCRWSSTLGDLEDTHQNVWGTIGYIEGIGEVNEEPTVFMGLYSLPDFYALWRHKGRKAILWCGSDITRFKKGYWLEEGGGISLLPGQLANWIAKYCESYVENEVEQKALAGWGIKAKIIPSFLGNINDYEVSFKPGNKVYTSVSGDEFELYGWYNILPLARENPEIEFHLYGNTKEPFPANKFLNDLPGNETLKKPDYFGPKNVIIHGRVPKEQMNAEIKEMQGALRLTEFDGFSEILAKSILWGQHPISPFIKYDHILTNVGDILKMQTPNLEGREHYRKLLNNYPWNNKK